MTDVDAGRLKGGLEMPLEILLQTTSLLLIGAGALFFLAGTVGLLRFPDIYTRLHALTKADHLGLGLVALGLLPLTEAWSARVQLLLIWALVLAAAATFCHLVAREALRRGQAPWTRGTARPREPAR
jgi:multicomponent Na+:H+ antiporter subunit G